MEKAIYAKAYIGDDLWKSDNIFGYFHSEFSNAININFFVKPGQIRMLTFICADELHAPDSIVLLKDELQVILSNGCKAVIKNGNRFIFYGKEDIVISAKKNDDLHDFACGRNSDINRQALYDFINTCNAAAENLKKSGFEKLPDSCKSELIKFSESLLCYNEKNTYSSFLYLVGAGQGLTPTCDDAIIGAISVAYCLAAMGKYPGGTAGYKRIMGEMSELIISQEKKLTTDVSLKYLLCAMRGEFSLFIHKMLFVLFSSYDINCYSLIEKIINIGNSSGMDMLEGIKTAVYCLLAAGGVRYVQNDYC